MKEPRGPLGRTMDAVAQGLAGATRRRLPRILVYDADGEPTLVRAGTPEHAAIAELAARLVALAREPSAARDGDDE